MNRTMRPFSLLLFGAVFLFSTHAFGQHVFRMSLQESITRAVEKGLVASDVTARYAAESKFFG